MPSVVITGGSAGVGRATALAFAARQWNVALVGRSDSGLEDAKRQIQQITGDVLAIQADVADSTAMFGVADRVVERWGTIEVWVNNAMASVFAPLIDLSPDEFRRVTDVTYHGYVFGTMAALRHMRPRNAGTIVQVGSALSYRAIPLQSAYCGAKFAIRGFTDALRSELQHEQSAIRLTMVQLPAVNTPQFSWARNKLAFRPEPIPPVYQPETIGELIFRASQTAPRELWVGMPSLKAIVGTIVAPGLLDRFLASKGYDGQRSSEPQPADQPDNLFTPGIGHKTDGRFDHGARTSAVRLNPAILRATTVALLILVVGAAMFALV